MIKQSDIRLSNDSLGLYQRTGSLFLRYDVNLGFPDKSEIGAIEARYEQANDGTTRSTSKHHQPRSSSDERQLVYSSKDQIFFTACFLQSMPSCKADGTSYRPVDRTRKHAQTSGQHTVSMKSISSDLRLTILMKVSKNYMIKRQASARTVQSPG